MGFIKRIFQLSLTKKEVVKSKRFMAVLMIPIFVFQMSSLNLLLLQTAIAEDGEVREAAVVEEIKEEPTEVEEAPASEELKEDNQPEEEVKPIEIEVKEIKVEEDPEESPIVAESPNVLEEIVPSGIAEVIDEVKKEAPPVLDPKTVEEKNQKDDKGGRITPEAAYDENLEAPTQSPVVEEPKVEEGWRDNSDGSSSIMVMAGNEYEFKDSGLKIKFTRIDNGTGEITVKEIELTPEQVLELGALSNKAWDITSDMADGTFEYELTLPVVENVDESKIQLVYVEEKEDLNDEGKIKAVEKEDVKVDDEKNELTANGLDHFTVYLLKKEGSKESSAVSIMGLTNGGCILDVTDDYDDLNCTANDIELAGPSAVIKDGCNYPGDTANFDLYVDVNNNASERYDVGVWISIDGDPNHDGSYSGMCSVANLPTLTPGFDLDFDACGDVEATSSTPDINNAFIGNITLPCSDVDQDGQLDVPIVTSWSNSSNEICNLPQDTIPETKAKCKTKLDFNIPVPVPGQIIIKKETTPDASIQDFNFNLSGNSAGNFDGSEDFSLSDGEAWDSGAVVAGGLMAGTYSVTESLVNNWDLTNVTCSSSRDTSTFNPISNGRQINLTAGDVVTCTFTNTQQSGHIIVDKVTDPSGDPQIFNFDASGGAYADFSLTDAAAPNDQTLVAGNYSVTETVPPGWALTSATCSDGSDPSSISLQAGETVTCTFTNTKLNPVINVEKSSTTAAITTAGQVVPYTFTVTNEGNQILTGITVVDPMCDVAPAYVSGDTNSDSKLDLNETWTYACSHTVIQVEIDGGGNLSNTVTADSNESDYDTDSLNIPIAQNATMTVEKSSATTLLSEPETVTYSYLVTNTGNVTLTGISLSDDNDNDDMNCPFSTLAPGAKMTCTATHTFTQGELDAGGSLDNIVTASSNEASDATDYLSIPISQYPGINITKVADVSSVDAVGDVINYTIEVENTGNQTLTGVFVSDPLIANLDCDETPGVPFVTTGLVINVDDTLTCTGTYAVTQFDIDNNGGGDGDIDNTATADSNQTDQDTASEAVDIIQIKSMTVEKSSATTILSAPATVTYSYLVTNTGNVTLTGITLSDDNDNNDMSCPFSTLAPASTMTCTATHTFTQGELDNNGGGDGDLDNIVTASSKEAPDATDNLSIPISQDPGIDITKDADRSSVNAAGNIITYTINVQNTGNTTLTGVSVNDPLLANLDCDATEGLQTNDLTIVKGGTLICTGTYTVTQSDIDNNGGGDGDIDNTATADSNQTDQDTASEEVDIVRNSLINIAKLSTTNEIITAGQVVPYTFTVTNEGNTTLNNVVVTDPKCDTTPAYQSGDDGDNKLQLDEVWNYSCNHTVTQDEINTGGNLYNMATADSDESDPDTDDFNIPISQLPALTIDKTATPTNYDSVGDVISYSYLVTNSGNVTLYNISVVDDKATVTCPDTSAGLAPLGQITCTASYIITQGDLDGGVVTNVAYATDGKTDSLIDTETVNAEQDPLLSIVKSGTFVDGNADGYADVGETITYTFTVKNEGNMTLTNVTVTDPKVTVNGGPTTLDVGETDATTFTATYTITQADIDAGKVDNTATADSNESGPANDDETVNLSQNPALTIDKTATPTNYDSVGDVISYSYLVTNSGNVTLYNISVVDDKATVTCPDTSAGLAPLGQITCTASYIITQADLDGGSVTNVAYATDGKTDSLIDTETVNSVAGKIIIEKQTLPNGDPQSFMFNPSWSEENFSLTDGQQNISGWLAPGPYSIAEIVPSGWDLTDAVCTAASDPNNSFDPRADGFILSDGDTITCVFTNTKRGLITVAKDAINNDAQDFEFTNNFSNDNPATFYLDDDSNGALPKLRTFEVLTGEYWVSEEAVPGWQQESATCDNGETIESINVEPGEHITCTFVNEEYAKIVLVKNTIGGDGEFDFDATGDGLPADIDLTTTAGTASQTFENLDQDNTYSITENIPAGWNLTGFICTGGNTPDKITPDPGETVTCTFTNTKKSNLTVVKKVINDNGGAKTVDDFGINFSGGALSFDAGVPSGDTTIYTAQTLKVDPGNYNLSENDVVGYTEGVWDCGAVGAGGISTVVNLAPGENKTCTIINDDVAPTITLNKNVIGGIAGVNEFGLTIGDVAVNSGVKTNVSANTPIALSEAGLDGYTFTSLTGDEGCPEALGGTVTLREGEEISCTITNTRDTGSITVNKIIDMDGNLQTTEDQVSGVGWQFDVDGIEGDTSDPVADFTGAEGNVSFADLKTGEYTIIENKQSGYDLVAADCGLENGIFDGIDSMDNVSVDKDGNTICNFYNVPNGTIHGYKWSDLNGNGERDCIEESGEDLEPVVFDDSEMYQCELEPLLSGWTINLYQSNGEGGFGSEPIRTMVTDSGSEHFGWYWFENLPLGEYKVCEVLQDDWRQTHPLNSDDNCHLISLPSGNSNGFGLPAMLNAVDGPVYSFGNQQLAKVTIIKFEDLDGNGQKDEGEDYLPGWEINLSGQDSVNTDENGEVVFDELLPESYVLSETLQPGWNQTNIYCEDNNGSGVKITSEGEAYGHHGNCEGWNQCGDAENCAQWACRVRGYSSLVSYGESRPCTQFNNCHLFQHSVISAPPILSIDSSYQDNEYIDYDWGNSCNVMGVTDIICSNSGFSEAMILSEDDSESDLVSENNYRLALSAGDSKTCYVGNQFVEPELTILKYNNQWPTVQSPGSVIDYTIKVEALENNVNDVVVTDLPPEGFKYISGSWSATSSLGGGHDGKLELSHEYASPGEWDLGDMKAGEVITLSYKAQIDGAQQPGLYNDLAWADGTDNRSARVLATSMPAPAVDPGEITDNFVGTQIELAVAPLPQNVELEEDEETETKTKKKVLGVTTYLPATGTPTMWIILAVLILIAGISLMIFARRRNDKIKNMKDKTLMLAVIVTGMMFLGADAQAMAPAIRLAQPTTPTEIKNQNIAFTVLDIDNRPVTVDCYKKGPADSDWVKFSTVGLPSGGSSGVCAINLDTDGGYDFYTEATAGGEVSKSKTVSLVLNTAVPGTPRKYNRNGGSCSVSFITADDGGLTGKVVMYRSKNTEFVADNSTKVQEGNFGSNIEGVLTDPNDNCDDYYYAIQAVSEGGIGSDFTGDEDVDVETRTRTRTVYEENIVYTGGGAIPVEETEGTITEEAGATATEGGVTEEGAVQGEATEGALSEGAETEQGKVAGMFSEKNSKYGWVLVGLAVLGATYYVMRRRAKKKSELPLDEN